MATGQLKVEQVKVNFLKIKILAKNQQKWPGCGRYLTKKFKISVFKPLWVSQVIYIPGEKIGHRVVHPSLGPEGVYHQKSSDMSILGFSIVGISKMISIFILGYPKPPQGRPLGGQGYRKVKIEIIFEIPTIENPKIDI